MTKITKIGSAKQVDEIIASLSRNADTTEELIVLRSYRDTTTGDKHLEWYATALNSKVWSIGALNFLAIKLMDDSAGWAADDEED